MATPRTNTNALSEKAIARLYNSCVKNPDTAFYTKDGTIHIIDKATSYYSPSEMAYQAAQKKAYILCAGLTLNGRTVNIYARGNNRQLSVGFNTIARHDENIVQRDTHPVRRVGASSRKYHQLIISTETPEPETPKVTASEPKKKKWWNIFNI